MIGLLFFFADHIWHVDFYEEYFEIHKLVFWKKIAVCDVKRLFITDTHKIQIWSNKKKKVASIDINCINYKKDDASKKEGFVEKEISSRKGFI